MNKKQLAVLLSKIKIFENPNVKLEQYATDSNIAADLLWNAFLEGDIENKKVIDLGCGPGVFGIGALVLGAKDVTFIDIDKKILQTAKKNVKMVEQELEESFKAEFINTNITGYNKKGHIVIQNPPFGVKTTHQDKLFLIHAMSLAPVVYSFHKWSTKNFIQNLIEDQGFKVNKVWKYHFPIKRLFWFHKKSVFYADVACWKMVKKEKALKKKEGFLFKNGTKSSRK